MAGLSGNIHVVIGDAHAKPGVSNERFEWAGQLVYDICISNPKAAVKVVEIGDWEDMPSLCSYDTGKKRFEGRTYKKDLEAAWDARKRFADRVWKLNRPPSMYALGGNHFEGRINRAVEDDRKLEGTLCVRDGRHAEFGWNYVPFLEPLALDGFNYQHYFTSGIMGRPIAGESPGRMLLLKQLASCIQGHNHLFDMCSRVKPDGRRVWGIHAGCFLAEDQWEEYAGPANRMWQKGILVLHGVSDGDFTSFCWYNIKDLRSMYG